MTFYTQISNNIKKTWLLISVFTFIILGIGFLFDYFVPESNGIFIILALVFSIINIFFSYFYSDKVILKINKAKPVKRSENKDLYNIVENLSITAGLPMPQLYIIQEKAPNAFATGRDPKHSVVCVTSGLLEILNKSELEAVVAHEMSHIGNRDILLASVVAVLVSTIILLIRYLSRVLMFSKNDRDNPLGIFVLIFTIISLILTPLISRFIQLAISRKREFLADAGSVKLTRYPDGLISALEKISNSNITMKNVSEVTRGMFISDPIKQNKKSWFNKAFMTHPPVEDRVKALKNMDI